MQTGEASSLDEALRNELQLAFDLLDGPNTLSPQGLNKQVKSDLICQIAAHINYPLKTAICSEEPPSLAAVDWMSETATELTTLHHQLKDIKTELAQYKQGLAFLSIGFAGIVVWWLLSGLYHAVAQLLFSV